MRRRQRKEEDWQRVNDERAALRRSLNEAEGKLGARPEEPAPIPPRRQAAIVWAAALLIGTYDGYYGPGTGTFLMLVFIHLGKMDTRHAAGGVKVINLASNIGGVCSALMAGTVVLGVGLAAALASILGHYLGAGLAIRNGSKIVRPAVVVVLLLLLVKVISELLFPNFWN